MGLLPWHVLLLGFCCGILALVHPWAALAGALLLGVAAYRLMASGPPAWAWALALAACFGLGLGYAALRLPDPAPDPPPWMAERPKVVVGGRVDQVVGRYDHRLRVILSDLSVEFEDGTRQTLPGRMNWTWEEPGFRPGVGRVVRFASRVYLVRWFGNPGQESFDFFWHSREVYWRTYLGGTEGLEVRPDASSGLSGLWARLPARLLHDPRDALLERTASLLPDTPGAGVVLALLFGERDRVASEDYQALVGAGLAHTLALSGMHLGFVVLLGLLMAQLAGGLYPRLYLRIARPKLAVLLAAPLVLAYVWLGQAGPSLTRAACMFGFWGLLLLLGRSRVLLDGLFLALALILAVSPLALFDMRLQLSFTAVGGIVLFMPWLKALSSGAWRSKEPDAPPPLPSIPLLPARWALGLLGVSLAATLAVLPLSTWYFSQFAPNLLANLVWLPLLGLVVMPLALGGLALAPVWSLPASWLLGEAAWVMDAMLHGLRWLEGLGLAPILGVLRPLWPAWLGFGLLAAVLLAALIRRRAPNPGRRNPDWLLAALAAVLLLWGPVSGLVRDGRERVSVYVVDVGAGQALLVTAPGGVRWLVDGGGAQSRNFDVGQALVDPWLSLGHAPVLSGVVLTHPHLDHYEGVAWLLHRFRVHAYAHNGIWPQSSYEEPLRQGVQRNGLEARVLRAGDVLDLAPGLRMQVLHPEHARDQSTNDGSLVLRLVWQGRGLALLCGDVEAEGIARLLDRVQEQGLDLSADLMVLPHHGSDTSASLALYEAVSPRLAVASQAWRDLADHPGPEVRAALVRAGIPWTGTAQSGMVRARWDGPDAPMAVWTFHGPADPPASGP